MDWDSSCAGADSRFRKIRRVIVDFNIPLANRGLVKPKKLIDLYVNRDELPSKHLNTIEPLLT